MIEKHCVHEMYSYILGEGFKYIWKDNKLMFIYREGVCNESMYNRRENKHILKYFIKDERNANG